MVILYLPSMYANRRNFRVFQEIGVEEHDCGIRYKSGSGNMAVSCMCNASGHNYRNSSFIVDLAMGQIPRSTECISSSYIKLEISTQCGHFNRCTKILILHKGVYICLVTNYSTRKQMFPEISSRNGCHVVMYK